MTLSSCALVVGLLLVALAGCGREQDPTATVTTTVSDGDSAATEEQPRPHGTIGVRLFGPVTLGMPERAVRIRFGRPDKVRDVNFGGDAEAPQTNWIWNVDGGKVTLKFDNSNGTLAAYSTTSPEFESAAGVSVGDSIRPVMEQNEGELVESPLGTGALVLSEGAPGSSPALTFTMAYGRDRIVEISGGAVVQPAGE